MENGKGTSPNAVTAASPARLSSGSSSLPIFSLQVKETLRLERMAAPTSIRSARFPEATKSPQHSDSLGVRKAGAAVVDGSASKVRGPNAINLFGR